MHKETKYKIKAIVTRQVKLPAALLGGYFCLTFLIMALFSDKDIGLRIFIGIASSFLLYANTFNDVIVKTLFNKIKKYKYVTLFCFSINLLISLHFSLYTTPESNSELFALELFTMIGLGIYWVWTTIYMYAKYQESVFGEFFA